MKNVVHRNCFMRCCVCTVRIKLDRIADVVRVNSTEEMYIVCVASFRAPSSLFEHQVIHGRGPSSTATYSFKSSDQRIRVCYIALNVQFEV